MLNMHTGYQRGSAFLSRRGQYVCSITHKHHPNLINLIVRAGHQEPADSKGQGPKRLVSETLFSYRQGARGITQRNARVLSDSVGNFCFQGSSAILRLIRLIRLCIFYARVTKVDKVFAWRLKTQHTCHIFHLTLKRDLQRSTPDAEKKSKKNLLPNKGFGVSCSLSH